MNMRMAVPHSTDVGQMQHNMNQQGALLQSYKSAKDKEKQELQLEVLGGIQLWRRTQASQQAYPYGQI